MTIEDEVRELRTELAELRTFMLDEEHRRPLYVTKTEAAVLCSVSVDTMRPLYENGAIRTVTFGATAERVPVAALVEYQRTRSNNKQEGTQ